LAIAVPLGLSAGPAAARRPRLPPIAFYKVVYEGSGSYSVKQTDGPSFENINSSFHWKVTYLLDFFKKSGQPVSGVARQPSGGGDWRIVSDNGGDETCSRNGGLKATGFGGIIGRVQGSGAAIMHVVPGSPEDFSTTDGSSGSQACDTTDFWDDWVTSFSHVGTSDTENFDPLTAFVNLSRADQRSGKVIVKVSNHTLSAPSLTVDPDCGSGNGASCTQTFDWKGSVTFTKTKPRG
jgi:hypothetical protein